MARHIKNESGWKQKENDIIRTKPLGLIRKIYSKERQSNSAIFAATTTNFNTKTKQDLAKAAHYLLNSKNSHLM